MAQEIEYTVGRGKPPVHSRFRKGQSGNPGGKPGAAKLAKRLFRQSFHRALGKTTLRLALAEPETAIEAMANQLVLQATGGKAAQVRLVLSLLEEEIEKRKKFAVDPDATDCKQNVNDARAADDAPEQIEAAALSLPQGKSQGTEKISEVVRGHVDPGEPQPDAGGTTDQQRVVERQPANVATDRNETEPFSLTQGKSQGKEITQTGEGSSDNQNGTGPKALEPPPLLNMIVTPSNMRFGTPLAMPRD